MSITIKLTPEVEQMAKTQAEARGISVEEFLPDVLTQALQQQEWNDALPEESLGRLTMLAAEPRLSRIWDTPEEDAAWKYLEDEDASAATVVGSYATMNRLWNTPEEDAAWKYLEDL